MVESADGTFSTADCEEMLKAQQLAFKGPKSTAAAELGFMFALTTRIEGAFFAAMVPGALCE